MGTPRLKRKIKEITTSRKKRLKKIIIRMNKYVISRKKVTIHWIKFSL